MTAKKIKPIEGWTEWCAFLHGYPILETRAFTEQATSAAASPYMAPSVGQVPEILKLRITPVTKRKVKR